MKNQLMQASKAPMGARSGLDCSGASQGELAWDPVGDIYRSTLERSSVPVALPVGLAIASYTGEPGKDIPQRG